RGGASVVTLRVTLPHTESSTATVGLCGVEALAVPVASPDITSTPAATVAASLLYMRALAGLPTLGGRRSVTKHSFVHPGERVPAFVHSGARDGRATTSRIKPPLGWHLPEVGDVGSSLGGGPWLACSAARSGTASSAPAATGRAGSRWSEPGRSVRWPANCAPKGSCPPQSRTTATASTAATAAACTAAASAATSP